MPTLPPQAPQKENQEKEGAGLPAAKCFIQAARRGPSTYVVQAHMIMRNTAGQASRAYRLFQMYTPRA